MPKDMPISVTESQIEYLGADGYAPIDILENDILAFSPELLSMLLKDHTTQRNILWATDDYAERGVGYQFTDCITVESITGKNGNIIIPRSLKSRQQQQQRVREMAEVFTPSWICNHQNNDIDAIWFGRENVFNTEFNNSDGLHTWKPTEGKIEFPYGKTWCDYITENRLEITCGEAPYLVSRYDTVTGSWLPIEMRIGLLDRKLRIVGENTETSGEWLAAAKAALRSIYGYEWQGDNLVLARVNILFTMLDYYRFKFNRELPKQSLRGLAYIISWNIWQMDGIKGVIPCTCGERRTTINDLFGKTEIIKQCDGCKTGNIREHNGKYAKIVEWPANVTTSQVKHKVPIRFIDLLK